MQKYSWSFNKNQDIWRNSADTIEDCIREAREENEVDDPYNIVYIAENEEFVPSVNILSMLEQIEEQALDEVGEVAEDWDTFNYKEDKTILDELEEQVQKVVMDWLEKHNRLPSFYKCENIKEISLTEGSEKE